MQVAMLGIDLGKNSCNLVGLDATGKVVVRRRMRRETVIAFCSKLPTCTVAMEACCGAKSNASGRTIHEPSNAAENPSAVAAIGSPWSGHRERHRE